MADIDLNLSTDELTTIANFLGYGELAAPVWFIGFEEGLGQMRSDDAIRNLKARGKFGGRPDALSNTGTVRMAVSLDCALAGLWILHSMGRGSRNRMGWNRFRRTVEVDRLSALLYPEPIPVGKWSRLAYSVSALTSDNNKPI